MMATITAIIAPTASAEVIFTFELQFFAVFLGLEAGFEVDFSPVVVETSRSLGTVFDGMAWILRKGYYCMGCHKSSTQCETLQTTMLHSMHTVKGIC